MNDELKSILYNEGVDIIRFVDISEFPINQTRGFSKAILFCIGLSKKFIKDIYNSLPTDSDEFLEKEEKMEKLADWISEYLQKKGYNAYAQSEKNNIEHRYTERGYIDPKMQSGISPLPHKTIANISGIGFMGKNNLFITEEFGCALSMCTVLTDAPISVEKHPLTASKCGDCNVCVEKCPAKAIHGNAWTYQGGRESIIDISKCFCVLKCMVNCPWSLKYANQEL
ncbi:epoxyqueuosine reductase [Clostridioides sp. ZZV15-6598]|uniref:epoxyqueuosine reductase n=1 Tax=Clostridioides sp. ZZV15-6598 TaxID=2811501 RepID=UPI001D0F9147|nr:epoxyqueuosine reductase [Clostridioides sp. ZZV15-6598]